MLNDLTTTIDSCKACQLYTPSQKGKVIQSQPMLKAAFSFQECAADLFTLNGNEYIVLVDRLTGFLCCDKVKKTSTSAILIKLTNWFNILGWPETIRTDGGPQFRSEFDEFCKSFYICHELSSPYHPESNGLAEAAVKNAKTLLKKCELTSQNFQSSLSVFRNIPCFRRAISRPIALQTPSKNKYLTSTLASSVCKFFLRARYTSATHHTAYSRDQQESFLLQSFAKRQ